MTADKQVISCHVRLGLDHVWVAVLDHAENHRRDDTSLIGRSSTWDGAIARAMNRKQLDIATARDEQEIAIAAHRQKTMKLMTKGREVYFLGLM